MIFTGKQRRGRPIEQLEETLQLTGGEKGNQIIFPGKEKRGRRDYLGKKYKLHT